jgi:hypothetical protein
MSVEAGSILFALFMIAWALCRCPHAWEFVDKTELPAPIETAHKYLNGIAYFPSDVARLCSKKVIIVIRCPNCGTAKVLRES